MVSEWRAVASVNRYHFDNGLFVIILIMILVIFFVWFFKMSEQVLQFLDEHFNGTIDNQTYSFVLELYDYVMQRYHHPLTSSDSDAWTDEEQEDLQIEVDADGYYSLR